MAARVLSNCAKAALGADGKLPEDEVVWEWLDRARDQIASAAAVRSLTMRDFATTVVMVITDGSSMTGPH